MEQVRKKRAAFAAVFLVACGRRENDRVLLGTRISRDYEATSHAAASPLICQAWSARKILSAVYIKETRV